jgi:hypothetical protein
MVMIHAIFCGDSSDQVLNPFFIFKCPIINMPVINDEPQVIFGHDLLTILFSPHEGVTHDCDQHVEQMNKQEQSTADEEEFHLKLL